MTVTDVRKDPEAKTFTIVAEFDAPLLRVWQLWADPRKLERWWGPPQYPATVVRHDLRPGGTVTYLMTGPEGDRHHGWWRIDTVDAPTGLRFEDGFANDEGTPNPEMPTMNVEVRIEELTAEATRMTVETTFPSVEVMDQLIEMGMEEGSVAAFGQIDDVLAAEALSQ